MKINLVVLGKNQFPFLTEGIELFSKRIKHYCNFSIEILIAPKSFSSFDANKLKIEEGKLFKQKFTSQSYNILLDEAGKEYDSVNFAGQLQKIQNLGKKEINFFVGGAFGFDNDLKKEADMLVSLSEMTFSHQLIRLIFVEQLYRAFTIINNQPYHNE